MRVLDDVSEPIMSIRLDDLRAYIDDAEVEPAEMIPVLVQGIVEMARLTDDPNRALDEAQGLLEGVTL